MAEHRKSTAALKLVTVAALTVTACAGSAVADRPAKTIQELSEAGNVFEVFRARTDRPEHQAAIVAIVQTREEPGMIHGLVFLQTGGRGHAGKGMICAHSDPRTDGALECHQHIGRVNETLTVGGIDSEFCSNLRIRARYA